MGGATVTAAGVTQALLHPDDNPATFYDDVMRGGCHINHAALVRTMVEESASSLRRLAEWGVVLDPQGLLPANLAHGEGHSVPRGYVDRREALGFCGGLGRALLASGAAFHPEVIACRLLTQEGRCVGALAFAMASGETLVYRAGAVVLASGGLGGLYQISTNPRTLTGDGYALAWEAGAELMDMEMVQFLPLAFPYPDSRRGLNIGICSLFGPGVRLVNGLGERFMPRYDAERGELSTRDVVSRAIFAEVQQGRGTCNGAVWLDACDHDEAVRTRFATYHSHIHSMLAEVFGERAARWEEPFEVIPSQHFCMGGVVVDQQCRSTVPGLFAAGEVAGGVHGANRLVGDALTEVFVFAPRAGEAAAAWAATAPTPDWAEAEWDAVARAATGGAATQAVAVELPPIDAHEVSEARGACRAGGESEASDTAGAASPCQVKAAVRDVMWEHFGPIRDGAGMRRGLATIEALYREAGRGLDVARERGEGLAYDRRLSDAVEAISMLRTARLVAASALAREESRGAHYRSDFPDTDHAHWLGNVVVLRRAGTAPEGGAELGGADHTDQMVVEFRPVAGMGAAATTAGAARGAGTGDATDGLGGAWGGGAA